LSIRVVKLTTKQTLKFAILSLLMDKSAMEKLSEWINAGLQKRGWSTIQLATRAHISKQVVSKYINRPPTKPDLDVLYRISAAFGAQITEPLMVMGYLANLDEVTSILSMLGGDDLNEIIQIAKLKMDREKANNKKQTSRSKRPAQVVLKGD
jgi:transcriptional regulator with XRE-family HTH domain